MKNTSKYQDVKAFTIRDRVAVVLLTILFIVPIGFVFFAAFVPGGSLSDEGIGVFKKLSLENFSILFQISFFKIFFQTVILCVVTTIFCMSISMVLANSIFGQKKSLRMVIKFFLAIWSLLAYPLVLLAIGNDWIILKNFENYWGMIGLYSWICLPLCALVLTIRMERYPATLLEMEQVDNLSQFAKGYVRTKYLRQVIVILSGYCLVIIWNDLSIVDIWKSPEEPWTIVQMVQYLAMNRQINQGENWAIFSVFFISLYALVFIWKSLIQEKMGNET